MSAAISIHCQRAADSLVSAERGPGGLHPFRTTITGHPNASSSKEKQVPLQAARGTAPCRYKIRGRVELGCYIGRSTVMEWVRCLSLLSLANVTPNLCRRRTTQMDMHLVSCLCPVHCRCPSSLARMPGRSPPCIPTPAEHARCFLPNVIMPPLSLHQGDGSPLSALPASLSHKYPCCPCLLSVSGLQQNRFWSRKQIPQSHKGDTSGHLASDQPNLVRPTSAAPRLKPCLITESAQPFRFPNGCVCICFGVCFGVCFFFLPSNSLLFLAVLAVPGALLPSLLNPHHRRRRFRSQHRLGPRSP